MVSNSPIHINKYFSGLEDVSIRHEGLYIEIKVMPIFGDIGSIHPGKWL
jgi:hypothetical protein